jgi:hypothetical protein
MATKQCKICGISFDTGNRTTALRYCPEHRPPTREQVKRTSPERTQRGVPVLYPGCAKWDRYSKVSFLFWLEEKEFPDGTEYIMDGERHTVCIG